METIDELKLAFDELKIRRQTLKEWKPHMMMSDYEYRDLAPEVTFQEKKVLKLLEQFLYPDIGAGI